MVEAEYRMSSEVFLEIKELVYQTITGVYEISEAEASTLTLKFCNGLHKDFLIHSSERDILNSLNEYLVNQFHFQ